MTNREIKVGDLVDVRPTSREEELGDRKRTIKTFGFSNCQVVKVYADDVLVSYDSADPKRVLITRKENCEIVVTAEWLAHEARFALAQKEIDALEQSKRT
jgi:precorrin-6B methylase 2